MLQRLLLTACFTFAVCLAHGAVTLSECRAALLSPPHKATLEHILTQHSHPAGQAVINAYLGCFTARLAEFSYNPISKWKYFSDGRKLIEEAVLSDSGDSEIRFIRFCVQSKAPTFLGYRDALTDDTRNVISALQRGWLDDHLSFRSKVATFMIAHAELQSDELHFLNQIVLSK